ncbi:MAG: hypothetical protein HGA65_04740, partial [Oscillochloris sp.]|nr:hypothetical protein [Oscillochloris sp.]
MPVDLPISDLVHQLSRVGLRPDERLVHHILAHGDAARAALLPLATDVKMLYQDFPQCFGPLHALRLLGEVPAEAMIRPLFAGLPIPIDDEEDDEAAPNIYSREILQIIGRVGQSALPTLSAVLDDRAVHPLTRVAAASGMAYVATYAPEVRDEVIAAARRRFAEPDQPLEVTRGLAILLAELGDSASYKPIMAAYRVGTIDQDLF